MNLQDLAFAQAITKKELLIPRGDKEESATVYLRPLPFHLVFDARDENDLPLNSNQLIARRISHCVVDESGEQIFTYEQALGTAERSICPVVVYRLANLISEVNNLGKIFQSSLVTTNSGVN